MIDSGGRPCDMIDLRNKITHRTLYYEIYRRTSILMGTRTMQYALQNRQAPLRVQQRYASPLLVSAVPCAACNSATSKVERIFLQTSYAPEHLNYRGDYQADL